MAIGRVFDGHATFVVGTHTHVPTNDGRVLNKGTAYLTDAGMCGDYNSVIGMNAENSINRFYKRESIKHHPAEGEASLCGAIIEANPKWFGIKYPSIYIWWSTSKRQLNHGRSFSLGRYKT